MKHPLVTTINWLQVSALALLDVTDVIELDSGCSSLMSHGPANLQWSNPDSPLNCKVSHGIFLKWGGEEGRRRIFSGIEPQVSDSLNPVLSCAHQRIDTWFSEKCYLRKFPFQVVIYEVQEVPICQNFWGTAHSSVKTVNVCSRNRTCVRTPIIIQVELSQVGHL